MDYSQFKLLFAAFSYFFSVLAPNNKALEPNTYYTVFIRAYVTNDVYTSTEWYPVVVTLREDDKMSK